MSPDFDALFLRARELTEPAERAAYLDAVTSGNAELRSRLDRLLADADAADEFFDEAAASSPGIQRRPGRQDPGEGPGTTIGRYRLLELIGEGGMGSVYLAEQREPVVRKVALKIIKLGMDTREVVARFEAERQALATMEHQGIAKVLDAGTTDTGRPYFVMELVHGLPITQFCDERQLSTKARLELFMNVCQAIQHAHQKGIIHRDLKPSNILVTLDGDRPVAKVIDFGIAKATGPRLTEKTFFTHFREFIGTPAYMSPEQADLRAVDIDTRSDIYSLGVLLYELLTGKTPFETTTLLSAGLDEIRRVIRETDPPKPSTRLNTMADAERTTAAKARQVDARQPGQFLRGDLDWIVMKALEKDRSRRYDTVSGLAGDLRRHLEGEAVLAAPPGTAYRLRKFARRHRGGMLTAAVLAGILVVATTVSVWQAIRARRAEQAAREERAEAEAVSSFLIEVFRSPDPARDGRTITVAEMLQRGAKRVQSNLADQPERQARLLRTLGTTNAALGLPREAAPLQEKARDHYLGSRGPEHPDTLSAMQELARSYFDLGRGPEALALSEEVLRIRRKVQGAEHPDTLTAMSNLANIYEAADRGPEALALRQEVLDHRRKLFGPEDRSTLLAMNNLSGSLFEANRRAEALTVRQQVLELSRKVLGPEDLDTVRAMQSLSRSWFDAGRLEEALGLREEVVRLRRQHLGPEHSDTLGAMAELVRSYSAAGRAEDALRVSEQVLTLCRQTLGPKHRYTLQSMDNLAISLFEAGRKDEAMTQREELLALSREVLGPDKLGTLKTANLLAISYFDAGRKDEALVLREAVMGIRRRTYPPDHPDTVMASEDLANSYFDAGRRDEALTLRQAVLALRRTHLRPGHPDILRALEDLATSYETAGRSAEATALREEAKNAPPPPAPDR